MPARTQGFMITLDRDDEFDLDRRGMHMRVKTIFVDQDNDELWCYGTNHFFGGRHEQVRLASVAGHRLTHYRDVIGDEDAIALIDNELSQALAA
jgi:alpha/beta superfamily hydrolase